MNRKQVKELAETNATYMFDKATKLYGEYTDEYARHFYNKLAELRSGIDDVHTCNCTNADRIRNMSDEKLAEFIQEMKNTCLVDFMGYADKKCEPLCEQDKISCKDCQAKAPTILEWLQSEAE